MQTAQSKHIPSLHVDSSFRFACVVWPLIGGADMSGVVGAMAQARTADLPFDPVSPLVVLVWSVNGGLLIFKFVFPSRN